MENSQALNSRDTMSVTERFTDWLNAPFPFYLNDDRKNFQEAQEF